ncbi:Zn-dependent exopeptidase [Imleria badia]|nr:Zn-dependent exopeptidase [Imleria badia]
MFKMANLLLGSTWSMSALAASRRYASKPHLAGTPQDLETASFLEKMETIWTAELEEVSDGTDPDAAKYATAVLAWHGISRGGEAQGKLIDANYGRKEDYDALVKAVVVLHQRVVQGTDFNGKIVIARYGFNFRGLKVMEAQELGAAAVLIYSDLRDDGTRSSYPHGPARNPTSVERGSVQFLSLYPGDTSTPGYPSYENSTRVDGHSKPRIPSLPISWSNAKVLLDQIAGGKEGPTVRLNTFGVIPGHIKDEVRVLGNHRDALCVLGTADPSAGTVSVHEAIRGFGTLLRNGWKPLRTILIASWDGEEYGLVGSTEWGEEFAGWIREHVVAYINTDMNSILPSYSDTSVSGSCLTPSASPLLAHLLRSTAEQIPHPTSKGRSLWDARLDKEDIKPVGSGSDYTVFLQHIGVASSNAGFSRAECDPVYHYHSVFNSQHWQVVYGDPSFSRHIARLQLPSIWDSKFSNDIIFPFNATHYSLELQSYLDRRVDLTSLRKSIQALRAACERLDTEKAEAEVKLRTLLRKTKKRQRRIRKLFPRRQLLNAIKRVRAVNDKLIAFERGFISKEGLKSCGWYKHLGVAPGKWLGYGATTLHGITEAITLDRDAAAAAHEVKRFRMLVDKLTEMISL